MNKQSVAGEQLAILKSKLEKAISSRATLEKDFSYQSNLLIKFIDKLPHVSKGIDLELDNRLAKLRVLLTKSAPIADIEQHIGIISKQLLQHAKNNEHNILLMHVQFHNAGSTLQQIKGLPDNLRRELRALLTENKDTKQALIQYVEIFSKLLTYYDSALKAKIDLPKGGLLNQTPETSDVLQTKTTAADTINVEVNSKVIEQFTKILNGLVLSDKHTKKLSAIKKKVSTDISNENLLKSFLATFNVIIEDFHQERKTAEDFLSTLCETLATVKDAVKTTLSTSAGAQDKQDQLNGQLQKQISSMTSTLEAATKLSEIKDDINHKLKLIAGTLDKKYHIEQESQEIIKNQLNEMTSRVDLLEKQSKTFEKRLHEQQMKSMQDALTKLSNRAAFDDYFAQQMVRFHHKPFKLAIVILDLDDFKRINDTYGHTAGDKTLQVIANTLTKHTLKDTFIGRYGGEEFVLIYSGIDKKALIEELNALKNKIARLPFTFKNNKVSITSSIGATYVTKNDNIHLAFERADEAMYLAKSKGKNQVTYL
jgi:diguanylate cyclase (GGDEF)-like protein